MYMYVHVYPLLFSFLYLVSPVQAELPASGILQVVVTETVDAGHFWVQRCDKATIRSLRSIMESISSRNVPPLQGDPHRFQGMFCLAVYYEDGEYYRARVDSVDIHLGMAQVQNIRVRACGMW